MTESLEKKKSPKTPEELAGEELAAQQEDLEKAREQIATQADYVPPAPFKVLDQYDEVTPGPVAYETHRGLIKVFSGDIRAVVEYTVHDAEGNPVLDENGNEVKMTDRFVVCSEAFLAMFPGTVIPPKNEVRLAQKIGNERRKGKSAPKTPSAPSSKSSSSSSSSHSSR